MNKKVTFPSELNDIRNFLPELVKILESGYEDRFYAFVMLEAKQQQSMMLNTTQSTQQTDGRGIVMRICANGCNYESSANCFDQDILRNKAEKLRDSVLAEPQNDTMVYQPLTWDQENISDLDPLMQEQLQENLKIVHFGTPYEQGAEELTTEKMSAWVNDVRKQVLNKKQELSMVGALLIQKVITKTFVDRNKNMSQSLLSTLGYGYAVSKKGLTVRSINGGMGGLEVATMTSENINHIAFMPEKLDNASHLTPGRYKLITGPDVTGVIAHEAFGHTQEGDTCRYGRSCAPGLKKTNTKVGNDHATIINNAAVFAMGKQNFGTNGSHFFDDEGQLARKQVILDKGILSSPMNDLLSSLKGDINGPAPRQSNGKRESWSNPIMARQTNTYFTAGDKTMDELIAMVDDGFLAQHAHGGMEDPKGMGLTAGTEYLEEIKQGKLTGKIILGPRGGHIELSDPVPKLLNSIIAKSKIDDDTSCDESDIPYNKWGGCGKYHKESVEAGCGGPYILWEGINCG